jgi:hypothetical protein
MIHVVMDNSTFARTNGWREKEYKVLLCTDNSNQCLLMWKEKLKEIAKCLNHDSWSLASDLTAIRLDYET